MANKFNRGESHALKVVAHGAGFPGTTYHVVQQEIAKLQNDNTRLRAEVETLREACQFSVDRFKRVFDKTLSGTHPDYPEHINKMIAALRDTGDGKEK